MANNVNWSIDKDVLTIKVNLKERHGPSSTGKTTVVASTGAAVDIGRDGIKFGLNVYTKEAAKK